MCASLLNNDCVVYSLGSRGDFNFENDLIASTQCTVVTFDCTFDGISQHPRHSYVRKCLGTSIKMLEDPHNWITIDAAMHDMGHSRLTLLKMDIEGAEYDVFAYWQDVQTLPQQISFELHFADVYYGTSAFHNASDYSNLIWPLHRVSVAEMGLLLVHLSNFGYGIVSREDNYRCPHCSELTLLRIA